MDYFIEHWAYKYLPIDFVQYVFIILFWFSNLTERIHYEWTGISIWRMNKTNIPNRNDTLSTSFDEFYIRCSNITVIQAAILGLCIIEQCLGQYPDDWGASLCNAIIYIEQKCVEKKRVVNNKIRWLMRNSLLIYKEFIVLSSLISYQMRQDQDSTIVHWSGDFYRVQRMSDSLFLNQCINMHAGKHRGWNPSENNTSISESKQKFP